MRAKSVLILNLILLPFAVSYGDIEKIAVIVGCNYGISSDPILKYAESDAQRLAKTLLELGDYRQDRMYTMHTRLGLFQLYMSCLLQRVTRMSYQLRYRRTQPYVRRSRPAGPSARVCCRS